MTPASGFTGTPPRPQVRSLTSKSIGCRAFLGVSGTCCPTGDMGEKDERAMTSCRFYSGCRILNGLVGRQNGRESGGRVGEGVSAVEVHRVGRSSQSIEENTYSPSVVAVVSQDRHNPDPDLQLPCLLLVIPSAAAVCPIHQSMMKDGSGFANGGVPSLLLERPGESPRGQCGARSGRHWSLAGRKVGGGMVRCPSRGVAVGKRCPKNTEVHKLPRPSHRPPSIQNPLFCSPA